MDIKDLNKSQLILLALLISFITSIATGIVTVTLLQQAPVSVTTPINRVVRETVEKIVPMEGKNSVKTVVIKEEDLIVDAIAKNQSALFSITTDIEENGIITEVSAGKGLVVSNDDVIVADALLVPGKQVYYVKNDSGKFKAEFMSKSEKGFSFLKIGAPLDEKNKLVYTVPTFGDLEKMKVGQKIILMGGTILSFIYEGSKDLKINVIKPNAGGLLVNLDGSVLGIALFSETINFASISDIKSALNPSSETPKA